MGESSNEKAEQIERDFGVLHPRRAMNAALRRRDDYHEVTPFHVRVGRDRLRELEARGFEDTDGVIVLLMRGSRIETVAKAAGETVTELVANVRFRLNQLTTLDSHYAEAQRNLNLMRRA